MAGYQYTSCDICGEFISANDYLHSVKDCKGADNNDEEEEKE